MEGGGMGFEEQESSGAVPDTVRGEVELRLPILGSLGTLATSVAIDARPPGRAAQLDATATLRSTSTVRLAFPDQRGTVAGELQTDGRVQLTLAIPGGVAGLDGDIAVDGPLTLSIPLPGQAATIELPAILKATAALRTDAPGCVRLDAQGSIGGPLVLRLPLAGGRGRLDLDSTLSGDTTLVMALPRGLGQLQAHLRAAGRWALRLALPAGGHITASAAINTPLTLSLVTPDRRAKLGLHDTLTANTALHIPLPRGGSIEMSCPIRTRLDGVLFLPSGTGELQAGAPIEATVRLNRVAIPHMRNPLTMDLHVAGAAELTIDAPARGTRLQAHFAAALPLAPLVRLLYAEVEHHVRVEHMELQTPRLIGAHDVALPLLVVVRRGVLAEIRVVAQLRIDPRSKQVELRSIHAHGLNAAGRAAAWLYLNPKLFRSLHHMQLFDPSGVLPAAARIDALGFKAASRDALTVEGVLTWAAPHTSVP